MPRPPLSRGAPFVGGPCLLLFAALLLTAAFRSVATTESPANASAGYEDYFNRGLKVTKPSRLTNHVEKSKVDVLGSVLKKHIEALRQTPDKQLELVFLIDSSASVGAENFFNELKFVKKLLADFTVEYDATRVCVITFSSRNRVVKHIDHVGEPGAGHHKCALFEEELPTISYQGGGTYTLGAVLQAQEVLEKARPNATKAVFLVTDGYSNGGDPRPAAQVLRDRQVEVFTFGIQNGNVKELYDMASDPPEEHSYILDSFEEFEALARRALHEDLQIGSYLKLEASSCDSLCPEGADCCDVRARCNCGTTSGHYACLCDEGFYGTGLKGDCHACPAGTYRPTSSPGDISSCIQCPDVNQVSYPSSTSVDQCLCKTGYQKQGQKCTVVECPELRPPDHGFFVSGPCGNVYNAACGVRCESGYRLLGSSIRLCAENGSWTGEEAVCEMKTCPLLSAPRHGSVSCTTEQSSFETDCFFSCAPGYALVGSKRRTCLAISLWDGLPALCRPISCPALQPVQHGSISPSKCTKGKSSYRDECFYECQSGFLLKGPKSRHCVDSGLWSESENSSVCVDVEAPVIKCPENIVVDAEEDEASALVEWPLPQAHDNGGQAVSLSVIPAVESPRRFDIGTAALLYTAEDRARNRARCNFTVTVRDTQPPTVDRCISPQTFLSRILPVTVNWEEPLFSDNSGKAVNVWRSTDPPAVLALGSTDVTYDVRDEAGNNSTCVITLIVQEHACALPTDPANGRANCTESEQGVFCAPSCREGFGFALRTPPFYFCAYDGLWQPADLMPFPDCSITFYSNSIFKMGTVSVMSNGLSCDNNFLLAQLEKHLERKISNRVSRICRSNIICEVENMIAECEDERDRIEEESNSILRRKRELDTPRRPKRNVSQPHLLAKSRAMNRTSTGHGQPDRENSEGPPLGDLVPPPVTSVGSEESGFPVVGKVTPLKRGDPGPAVNDLLSEEVLQNKIELEFQLIGKLSETSEERREQAFLVSHVQSAMRMLADAAHRGELDLSLGNNRLSVEAIRFGDGRPRFVCDPGTVAHDNICLKCPVGTYFNVVSETCESCAPGTYQFQEGQFSCLVCPDRTSTTAGQSKSVGECKAQCLPGTFSTTGLEPCETCPRGQYQPSYSQFECRLCPPGTTTYRRGVRTHTECKALCPPGQVSKIGLQPCFSCPDGFFQAEEGGKSCFSCPKDMKTGIQGAKGIFDCIGITEAEARRPLPVSAELTINDCFSVPCYHGATCKALEIGFLCLCKPGYTGIFCETEIDECEPGPCRNGASCRDETDGFTCFCPPGFEGKQCEQDVDDCRTQPCFNGASCFDRVNGFHCKCAAGFVGPLCQYNVDECLSGPCRNGGRCVDRIAGYECECAAGFGGPDCEINLDDCVGEPCANNATCVDDIQSFTCRCPAGFEGRLCEVDVNECRPEPCMNGATCVDGTAGFKCLCPPSYAGDLCETELSSDFVLHFPSSGIVDFVQLDSLPRELTEATACFWMRSGDKLNYGTPFSYAADAALDNLFTLTDYSGFVLYVNMEKVVTDVTANDGFWHHLCVTWSSTNGAWALYKDGRLVDSGSGLATGTRIPATGTLVLGQEQDQRGAGFSSPESFIGTMALLNIWDRALEAADVAAFTTRCDKYNGNVKSWADFLVGFRGRVERKESHFCSGCTMPESPSNGEVSVSGMKTQAQLSYACNPGYEIQGAASRRCMASGNWSHDEPVCTRISCDFPGYIANGYINGRQYLFQDIIQYVCNPGHRLVGDSTRTCLVDGRWSGDPPRCEELLCEPPQGVDNGFVAASSAPHYRPGQLLRFACDEGYRLDGSSALTCAGDGQWDDAPPTCQPRSCESPPRVPHGSPAAVPEHLDVGSVIRYRCDEGFWMVGSGEMHCELRNRWGGALPRCERVTCGPPTPTPHASIEGKDHRFGSSVIYKCDQGYELTGTGQSTCKADATWSTDPPECVPVSCGALEHPERGGVEMGDVTYGSVVKYYCHTGYELQGVKSRKCRSSGDWSGEAPACVPVSCSQPESISNGRYIGSDWTVGNTVTYGCNPGYVLIGEADRMCLDTGQWLHEVPGCEPIECSVPDGVQNGSLKNDGRRFGQRTTYACDEGHRLVGPSVRVCMEDQMWEPAAPECRPVSCGTPPQAENLIVETTSRVFRGVARYGCREGFRLEGPAVRHCRADGEWSGSEPTCDIIRCPDPVNVAHAYLIYSDNRFGSVVEYYCDEGYKLVGPVQRLCAGQGHWQGSAPECAPVRCALPSPLPNGDVAVESTTYHGTATYSCHKGYELRGPGQRTCLQDETWGGPDPSCVAIRCSTDELTVANGRVIGESDVLDATIQYECNVGYRLVGTSTRTCEEEKRWSGLAPQCEKVLCPLPVTPTNGKISWRGHSFGDTLTASCHEGYVLTGDSARSCLPDGTWSGTEPHCMPVQCATLPDPVHGRTVVKSSYFGGRAEYECQSGYKLRGAKKRFCKADRRWSEKEPSCQQILCPEPPSITHGYVLTPSENLTVDVIVEYHCDKGFNIEYPSPRLFCNPQGKWAGVQPACTIVSCPKPPTLQFGYQEGQNYTFKNSIHFSCNLGWKLIGETTLTCEADGHWSSPFPSCEGTLCPDPDHVDNGFISSSDFSNGAVIRYSCRKGYEIAGSAEHKCQNDNTWSGKLPLCKPVTCEPPKNITHGKLESSGHEYGSKTIYKCNAGYELHGVSVLTCTENRHWSSDSPVCEQISCPLPEPLPHGEILVHSFSEGAVGREIQLWPDLERRGDITIDGKTMLEASRSDIFHLGDKIIHRCTSGYKLSGDGHRVCEETGTWSKNVPECKPVSCSSPENIIMGDMVVTSVYFKAEVSYSCEKGYRMKGPSTRQCQANATWSSGLPTCQPIVCPIIQNIPHGIVKWTSLRYGASATYECLAGYRIIGKAIRLCELTGQWSEEEPYCVARECGKLSPLQNGWIEADGIVVGSTATYRCDDGYELEGSFTRSCLVNESWSFVAPSCRVVSCLPPPDIDHGRVEFVNQTYQSVAEYVCDMGYELDGSSFIKCLANKMWSGSSPKCMPLPCSRPVPPAHGTVLFRSLVVDSVVHFSCSEGYEIHGSNSTSICLPNQTWSSDPPVCRLVSCHVVKDPKHGLALGASYTFGAQLTFKCNSKYRLDGPESVTCLANKNWSKSPPKCKRYLCDAPASVANSEVPLGPYVIGHSVEYACEKGYLLKGNKTMSCDSSGQWIGKFPSCDPVDCGFPPPVNHSQMVSVKKWTLGATVSYICDYGYRLKGAVTVVCGVDGNWTDGPICEEIHCEPPPSISHSNATVENRPGLSTVTYTCNKGYKLLGLGKHSCVGNGTWNVEDTSCEPVVCGEPPSIPFGGIASAPSSPAGSRRTYHCFPGFRIVGTPTVQCSGRGLWEGTLPHCAPVTCPPPDAPEQGSVDGLDFSFQSAVLYSCHKGHEIYGRDTRFCLDDGSWSGEKPLCRKISCGQLDTPENGYVVQSALGVYLDKVQFACHKGFELTGSEVTRCTDTGKWDKPVPRCTGITCSVPETLPPNVVSLSHKSKTFGIGDRIAFVCEPGFLEFGDLSSHCLANGSWSLPAGGCKKMSCGRPRTNTGAILLGMSYQYRDHLVVVCPPGSKVKGKKILTCESVGEWNGRAECEGMCPRPCLNGGACIPPGLCSCPSGFVGDVCQHAVCILPCLNGGTCVGPYKCACKEGFAGSRCQTAAVYRKKFPYG